MKKRIINGIEFSQGSKNIFADLGLPDADKLKIKTDLVIQIIKALERLHLTQAEAAKRMGISQPKVSAMINGNFSNLTLRTGGLPKLNTKLKTNNRTIKL